MLYCIGTREQGICKIGYTADYTPLKRLKSLQTGNPYPLAILGVVPVGDYLDESVLHQKFKPYKISGEWFTLTEEIADYFSFPLEPVDKFWVVALTYMQKDMWDKSFSNAILYVFSPSEQEAIAKAKVMAKLDGGCVKSMAASPSREDLMKAIALMDEAAFAKTL